MVDADERGLVGISSLMIGFAFFTVAELDRTSGVAFAGDALTFVDFNVRASTAEDDDDDDDVDDLMILLCGVEVGGSVPLGLKGTADEDDDEDDGVLFVLDFDASLDDGFDC